MTRRPRDEGRGRAVTAVAPRRGVVIDRRATATRVSAPPERERRPRRRRWAVAKFCVVAVLIAATLAVAGEWVLRQSYFRVQHVSFVGVHHEPLALVLAASGLTEHPTMMSVNVTSLEKNLAQFTWIDGLSVTKRWPNTVLVTVKEGTAVAVAFGAKHALQYVDEYGRDLGPAPLAANLPTLSYVDPRTSVWPYQHAGRSAAYVASQLPRAFSTQVSTISENDHGQVSLKMTTPLTFILGPATQLHAKFVAIASVIAHSTLSPGDVVDATVPDELAVTGPAPS
jgi:cell division protein FtsQ